MNRVYDLLGRNLTGMLANHLGLSEEQASEILSKTFYPEQHTGWGDIL